MDDRNELLIREWCVEAVDKTFTDPEMKALHAALLEKICVQPYLDLIEKVDAIPRAELASVFATSLAQAGGIIAVHMRYLPGMGAEIGSNISEFITQDRLSRGLEVDRHRS